MESINQSGTGRGAVAYTVSDYRDPECESCNGAGGVSLSKTPLTSYNTGYKYLGNPHD